LPARNGISALPRGNSRKLVPCRYNREVPSASPGQMLPVVLIFVCAVSCAAGQIAMSPGSSSAALEGAPAAPSTVSSLPAVEIESTPGAPVHAFWDRTNLWLFVGVAFSRGMDYASTRNMQARGRQEILLPSEIVNNSAAFASLEAAGTLSSIGISYVFHRTGHHKLERWMSIGHISVTSFGAVRNYCLESRHVP